MTPPSPERLRQIESNLLEDLQPVRPLPSSPAIFASIMSIAVVTLAAGSAALGANGWRVLTPPQKLSVYLPLAFAIVLLAIAMGKQMSPSAGSTRRQVLLSLAALAGMAGWILALFPWSEEAHFYAAGLTCLRAGLVWGAISALAFLWIIRRGAMLIPALTGATAGTFAGVLGLGVLEIHCPDLNAPHILVWHFGVVIASTLSGMAVAALCGRERSF